MIINNYEMWGGEKVFSNCRIILFSLVTFYSFAGCKSRHLNEMSGGENQQFETAQNSKKDSELDKLFKQMLSSDGNQSKYPHTIFLGRKEFYPKGVRNSLFVPSIVPSLESKFCSGLFVSLARDLMWEKGAIERKKSANDPTAIKVNDVEIFYDWRTGIDYDTVGSWQSAVYQKNKFRRTDPHVYRLNVDEPRGTDGATRSLSVDASFEPWHYDWSGGSYGYYLAILDNQGKSVPRYTIGFILNEFLKKNGDGDLKQCISNEKCQSEFRNFRDQNYTAFGNIHVRKTSGWDKAYVYLTFYRGWERVYRSCTWEPRASEPQCGSAKEGGLSGHPRAAFQVLKASENPNGVANVFEGNSSLRWTAAEDPSRPTENEKNMYQGYVSKEKRNVVYLPSGKTLMQQKVLDESVGNLFIFEAYSPKNAAQTDYNILDKNLSCKASGKSTLE